MRSIFCALLFFPLVVGLMACKEVPKGLTPAGLNVVVHDIPCEEVVDRILKECRRQDLPFEWADKDQRILLVGPLTSAPLSGDPFKKMEEKIRLETKCIDPLSTRLSLQLQLRGLTADLQWTEITDSEKLNGYGKRFFDRFLLK